MAELPPLIYDTLTERQVRLLVPSDLDSGSGLSWALKRVDIDDPGLGFVALSYAWASRSHPQTFPISCNGRQIRVHHNLYTALPFLAKRMLTDKTSATAYWIDAICINQTDEAEKISQIRLMSTVYRKAERALVWLGLALEPEWQDLIPRAIQLFPLLVKEYARCRQLGMSIRTNVEIDRELSHLGRPGWEAILHLIRNTYFQRVWVVQEIALARDVTFLCGDHEIASHLMEQAVSNSWPISTWAIYDLELSGPMRIQAPFHDDGIVFQIRNIVRYSGQEGNAHQTIRIANLLDNQTCCSPQDRVLGILGMVQEEFGDASKDLHACTATPELYTEFSTLLFGASALTNVHWWFYLSLAFNKTRIDGLPSWVPDLHHNDDKAKRQPYESMIVTQVQSSPLWQASSQPRKAAYGPRFGEIVIWGKLLDVVTLVHPEVPHFPDRSEPGYGDGKMWLNVLVSVIEWERKLANTVTCAAAEGCHVPEDTYWRSVLADLDDGIASDTQSTYETLLQFRKIGLRLLNLVPMLEELRRYATTSRKAT